VESFEREMEKKMKEVEEEREIAPRRQKDEQLNAP
jgi:hypothetical protein